MFPPFLQAVNGSRAHSHAVQNGREIQLSLAVGRRPLQRQPVILLRLLQPAAGLQHDRQVEQHFRIIRPDFDCSATIQHRFFAEAALEARQSEVAVRRR